MKVIFTEGSIHYLKTMEINAVPRVGEELIVDNRSWIVEAVTHLPKVNGVNDNETYCAWDEHRDADLSIHLKDNEQD